MNWITDRKPDKKDIYLVTLGWEGFRHVDTLEWTGKYWIDSEGWPENGVLAWAPMPEPWEG